MVAAAAAAAVSPTPIRVEVTQITESFHGGHVEILLFFTHTHTAPAHFPVKIRYRRDFLTTLVEKISFPIFHRTWITKFGRESITECSIGRKMGPK